METVAPDELPPAAPLPWTPAMGVTGRSSVKDILNAMHFGRPDLGYDKVSEKFEKRKISTAGELQDFQGAELVSMLRGIDGLKMHPRALVAAIGTAIQHNFFSAVKAEGGSVKAEGGGSAGQCSTWNHNCTKVSVSAGFNVSKYIPDGRVYAALPSINKMDELKDKEEDGAELVVDFIWIDAQCNPEKSMGDYLPEVRIRPRPPPPRPPRCRR